MLGSRVLIRNACVGLQLRPLDCAFLTPWPCESSRRPLYQLLFVIGMKLGASRCETEKEEFGTAGKMILGKGLLGQRIDIDQILGPG